MSLPTIRLGPLTISRLLVGGNPFSGISHQSPERDREMADYFSAARIKQTLAQCEALGINACVLRADAHIWRLLREYRNEGGRIQWVAQTAPEYADHEGNIDRAIANGAVAVFVHGGLTEQLWTGGQEQRVAELVEHIRSRGVPAGVAGHAPQVHLAIHEAGIPTDFHMVSFYNCGSVHGGRGDVFDPDDPARATEVIRRIPKPCLAYKVLAAGRVDTAEALRYAYAHIKPTDGVVVGMFPKDKPRMVEENVRLAAASSHDLLGSCLR